MSFERVTDDATVGNPRLLVSGFVAGALAVCALGLAACATTGSSTSDAKPADAAESQPAAAPPTAPPVAPPPAAAPPAPAPATAPPPAAPPAAPPAVSAPAAASAGDSPAAQYLADPAAIQRASQLFRAVCTGYCHTTQAGAVREAPNLFDCEWDHGASDQEIFNSIAQGIPDTQMQGFGERLPHEDLWKIVAFMRQKSTC